MGKKLLTIAVPSYNAEKYLPDTIPTILSAKNVHLIDLLIVNDGSSDGTGEIAEEFERNYPDIIRVLNKPNGGHGSAVNAGIKNAYGTYFKIVDADDWVDTENLDDLIEYLKETDVDEILSPYYRVYVNQAGDVVSIENYNEFSMIQTDKVYQVDSFYEQIGRTVGMHTMTLKTKLLKENQVELSENMYYVDMEYITYVLPYIETVFLFNKPIYKYRLGTSTQSISIESYIKNRSMHKQVTFNLIDFYNQTKLGFGRSKAVKNLIINLINQQWNIYFNLNNVTEAKKELIEFEKSIAIKNKSFLKNSTGLKMNFVRKSRYHLFNIAKYYSNWRVKS
uniref:Putative glycosyl transferase n=1 Tax=Streptococcus pneumoniae TaxID=1313 RepID=Q4JZN0_STREE|nr:putative glycosyl transferase [Streptococcus pneumoniae]